MAAGHRPQRRRQGAQATGRERAQGRGAAARPRRRFALSLGPGDRRAGAPAGGAQGRSRRAPGRAAGEVRQGRGGRQGRSRGDAAPAPDEGRSRAADRARRHRRRLAGDAGGARADRACRHGGRRGGALSAARRRRRAASSSPPTRQAPEAGQRLHRARDGQDGRLRAQLFERHRSHRLLRPGRAGARRQGRCRGVPRAHHARPGEAPAGAHRRRLRVPRRSAAAARSGLDPDRGLDRNRAQLLRQRRPELGARGDDQGARLRRRHRGRRGHPARSFRPSSGGSISTSPRSPTSRR